MARRILVAAFLFSLSVAASGQAVDARPDLVPQAGKALSGTVLAMSPDGRYIAESDGGEPFLSLWTSDGIFLRTIETPLAYIWSAAFTHDGRILVSGSSHPQAAVDESPDVYLLDRRGGILAEAPIGLYGIHEIAPHADRRSAWAAGTLLDEGGDWADGYFLLGPDLSIEETFANRDEDDLLALAPRPDGAFGLRIAGGGTERGSGGPLTVEIYDDRTGLTNVRGIEMPAGYEIRGVFPRDDGSLFVLADGVLDFEGDAVVLLFQPGSASPKRLYEAPEVSFTDGCLSPDGSFFAAMRKERHYRTESIWYVRRENGLVGWDARGNPLSLPEILARDASGTLACDASGRVLAPGREIAFLLSPEADVERSIEYPELEMGKLRFSPDGSRLYSSGDSLRIWDATGKLLKSVLLDERMKDFIVKDDGTLICLEYRGFSVFDADGHRLRRMNWEDVLRKNGLDFAEPLRTAPGSSLSPSGVMVFSALPDGGDEIAYFIDDEGRLLARDEDQVLAWRERAAFGRDGEIFFAGRQEIDSFDIRAYDWRNPAGIRELPPDEEPAAEERDVVDRMRDRYGLDSWGHGCGEGYSDDSWPPPYDYSPDGRLLATAGPDGKARLRDRSGRILGEFEGHGAAVEAVAFHPGGSVLATSSRDGSIRLWNTATGDSASLYARGEEWLLCTDDGYFDCSPRGDELAVFLDGEQAVRFSQFALFRNRPDIILDRLGLGTPEARNDWHLQYLRRLAKSDALPARLPTADFEHILLASGAEQGRELTGAYRRSSGGFVLKEDAAVAEKFALVRNPAYRKYAESLFRDAWVPPSVDIVSSRIDGETLYFELTFSSTSAELSSFNIAVDGVPLYPGRGRRISGTSASATAEVPLLPGENLIEATCYDSFGIEGLRRSFTAVREAPEGEGGRLWFLGFGVSEYADEDLSLIFPAKDVADLEALFAESPSSRRDFKSRTWTDGNCTVESLDEARAFLRDAAPEDTVVLFISGHGVHDEKGVYYFLTHETELDDLEGTAAPFSLLSGLLDGIAPRRKLFLMDTCESGELDPAYLAYSDSFFEGSGTRPRSIGAFRAGRGGIAAQGASPGEEVYGVPSSYGNPLPGGSGGRGAAVRESSSALPGADAGPAASSRGLGAAGIRPRPWRLERDRLIHRDIFRRTGAVVFSSSRGGELSYEPYPYDEEGNGFFTGAVIDALRGFLPDRNGDGLITTGELEAAVSAEVSVRSRGLQNPVIDRENLSARIGFPVREDAVEEAAGEDSSEALMRALDGGNAGWAARLLEKGVDADPEELRVALVEAASEGDAGVCGLLARYVEDTGDAVRAALRGFRTEALWALMRSGTDIPLSAVYWASADGRLRDLEALADDDTELLESLPISERLTGERAVHLAANAGLPELTALLLRAGAPVPAWLAEDAESAGFDDTASVIRAFEAERYGKPDSSDD